MTQPHPGGYGYCLFQDCTVKPMLKSHPKLDKTKILMTKGSLMKVESIAELQYLAILLTCI